MTNVDIKNIFPLANTNMNRYAFFIPEISNQEEYRVQIKATKKYFKDCNYTWFTGNIESKILDGWGYNYYVVNSIGDSPAATKMACNNYERKYENVEVFFDNSFLSYNSKLPIVVYAPKDIELYIKIWSSIKIMQPVKL